MFHTYYTTPQPARAAGCAGLSSGGSRDDAPKGLVSRMCSLQREYRGGICKVLKGLDGMAERLAKRLRIVDDSLGKGCPSI